MKKPVAVGVIAIVVFSLVGLLGLKPSPSRESFIPLARVMESEVKQVERLFNRLFVVSAKQERDFGTNLLTRGMRGKIEKSPAQDSILPITTKLMAPSPLVTRYPMEYFFIVVSSEPRVNAFALPGGYVFVFEGLLKQFTVENSTPAVLRNPDAVAFVLAHEIGHVELLHTADSIRHKTFLQRFGASSFGSLAELLRAIAHPVYSEIEELEADAFALRLMKEKGFRLEGAIDALEAVSKGTPKRSGQHAGPGEVLVDVLSDYANTHPIPQERINHLKKAIEILNAQD